MPSLMAQGVDKNIYNFNVIYGHWLDYKVYSWVQWRDQPVITLIQGLILTMISQQQGSTFLMCYNMSFILLSMKYYYQKH